MALWSTKEYSASLATLVEPNVGSLHPKYTREEEEREKEGGGRPARKSGEADPSVFNFYI